MRSAVCRIGMRTLATSGTLATPTVDVAAEGAVAGAAVAGAAAAGAAAAAGTGGAVLMTGGGETARPSLRLSGEAPRAKAFVIVAVSGGIVTGRGARN